MSNSKSKPAAKVRSKKSPKAAEGNARPVDAIRFLKEDHREVKSWFKAYEKLDTDTEKQKLADKICLGLSIHMRIEEEIFYPAIRPKLDHDDLLSEAEVEHGSAKQLIADIRRMRAGEPLFSAKVKVLGEYIVHHVEEEESEMFPEVRGAKLDLKALGLQLAELKSKLTVRAGN